MGISDDYFRACLGHGGQLCGFGWGALALGRFQLTGLLGLRSQAAKSAPSADGGAALEQAIARLVPGDPS